MPENNSNQPKISTTTRALLHDYYFLPNRPLPSFPQKSYLGRNPITGNIAVLPPVIVYSQVPAQKQKPRSFQSSALKKLQPSNTWQNNPIRVRPNAATQQMPTSFLKAKASSITNNIAQLKNASQPKIKNPATEIPKFMAGSNSLAPAPLLINSVSSMTDMSPVVPLLPSYNQSEYSPDPVLSPTDTNQKNKTTAPQINAGDIAVAMTGIPVSKKSAESQLITPTEKANQRLRQAGEERAQIDKRDPIRNKLSAEELSIYDNVNSKIDTFTTKASKAAANGIVGALDGTSSAFAVPVAGVYRAMERNADARRVIREGGANTASNTFGGEVGNQFLPTVVMSPVIESSTATGAALGSGWGLPGKLAGGAIGFGLGVFGLGPQVQRLNDDFNHLILGDDLYDYYQTGRKKQQESHPTAKLVGGIAVQGTVRKPTDFTGLIRGGKAALETGKAAATGFGIGYGTDIASQLWNQFQRDGKIDLTKLNQQQSFLQGVGGVAFGGEPTALGKPVQKATDALTKPLITSIGNRQAHAYYDTALKNNAKEFTLTNSSARTSSPTETSRPSISQPGASELPTSASKKSNSPNNESGYYLQQNTSSAPLSRQQAFLDTLPPEMRLKVAQARLIPVLQRRGLQVYFPPAKNNESIDIQPFALTNPMKFGRDYFTDPSIEALQSGHPNDPIVQQEIAALVPHLEKRLQELNPELKVKWNGEVFSDPYVVGEDNNALYQLATGKIGYHPSRSDAATRWRSWLHELLHSASNIGTTDSKNAKLLYEQYKGWEEAPVEILQRLLRPELLKDADIDHDINAILAEESNWGYQEYIDAAETIRTMLGDEPIPFYTKLLSLPLDKRDAQIRIRIARELGAAALIKAAKPLKTMTTDLKKVKMLSQ